MGPASSDRNLKSHYAPYTVSAHRVGCIICRIRRKKCVSAANTQGHEDRCADCAKYNIECWKARHRPMWMRDSKKLESFKNIVKDWVANYDNRRLGVPALPTVSSRYHQGTMPQADSSLLPRYQMSESDNPCPGGYLPVLEQQEHEVHDMSGPLSTPTPVAHESFMSLPVVDRSYSNSAIEPYTFAQESLAFAHAHAAEPWHYSRLMTAPDRCLRVDGQSFQTNQEGIVQVSSGTTDTGLNTFSHVDFSTDVNGLSHFQISPFEQSFSSYLGGFV